MRNARLKSLQVLPDEDGWESPLYKFGRLTTLVTGENGAGKTPMLRALAVALGAKLEIPPDVLNNCRGVRVVIGNDSETVTIERSFAKTFATFAEGGKVTQCFSEEDISKALLRVLEIHERSLVRRNANEPVPPYMSVLAPIFFVDQDRGWGDIYEPPPNVNFVQEQKEEALRWILEIPQRTIAAARRDRDEAKQKEAALEEQLAVKRRVVESLRRQAGDDAREGAREALEAQKQSVTERLNGLLRSFDGLAKVDAALDADLREVTSERDTAAQQLSALERQALNLRQTRDELSNETSVLEANEIAANVFRVFCGKEDCNLFKPQDSYGRRLLHLRDQLKDIDSTTSLLAQQIEQARRTVAEHQARVDQRLQARRATTAKSGGEALVAAIESLTRETSDISIRLDRLQMLEDERKRLAALLERTQKASELVAQLATTRSSPGGSRLADARTLLAASTEKWLRALNARHVGTVVQFDTTLTPTIAGARFSAASSQSGSTRTRVVLALHAAIIETSIAMKGNHPGFLILDAPRQQELERDDLAAFVTACERMFADQRPPFQLVVGAKERDIFASKPDAIWEPTFESADGMHYLG